MVSSQLSEYLEGQGKPCPSNVNAFSADYWPLATGDWYSQRMVTRRLAAISDTIRTGHPGPTARAARTWRGLLGTLPWLQTGQRVLVPIALYLGAAVLLLVRLGSHPGFAYNWESYTAWEVFSFWDHPSRTIFSLTDGLMTDSGNSPLIALPAWLSFRLFGIGLTQLRLPVVLIGAAAVPLTWLVGRRLVGRRPALLGAILLALSPVYLLYGRTATLVGISLTPALLTIYALVRVLQGERAWRWLLALQLLLVLDAYAYAPIRFLWPLSLALFASELIWRRDRWRWRLGCLLLTLLVLPLVLLAIDRPAGDGVASTVVHYYHARGEQLLAFQQDPQAYDYFLRLTPAEQRAGKPEGSADQLALRLIRQNAADYGNLLLDRDTRPAITDYWNPQGRLYPWFLVPLFVLGMLWSLRHLGQVEQRVMQAMFWGFGLPLLLTSRVHIGRLIFAVPWLMLFVALGGWLALRALHALARRLGRTSVTRVASRGVPVVASLILLAAVGRSTWVDYRIAVPPTREAQITADLTRDLPGIRQAGGSAVLLLAADPSQLEPETISAASIRLGLGRDIPFVNLGGPAFSPDPPTTTTAVYYGGLLFGRLQDPARMPTYCQDTYYVAASLLAQFTALAQHNAARCRAPLRYVVVEG